MTKFERFVVDFFDHALRAPGQMHSFATPIVLRIFSRDPAIVFKSVQYCNQSWLFDAEMGSNLGLGQRSGRH